MSTFLILDNRKRTYPHFQLLFELLKGGFVILKLYSHVVITNYQLLLVLIIHLSASIDLPGLS